MDVNAASQAILEVLLRSADSQRADHDRAYLKLEIEHWGVSVGNARAAVQGAGRRLDRDDLIAIATDLWDRGVYDTRLAAALLLDRHAQGLLVRDLPLLESFLRSAGTWALVDVLVPRPVAAVDARDRPATTLVLDRWAVDSDFWLRRSALLAHLIPLREGADGEVWERFSRYADALLDDTEFFVRKATGWVLREAGRRDPDRVRDWVAPRITRISGVALREAVKPLTPDDREALLAARR